MRDSLNSANQLLFGYKGKYKFRMCKQFANNFLKYQGLTENCLFSENFLLQNCKRSLIIGRIQLLLRCQNVHDILMTV